MKDALIQNEQTVLRALCFETDVIHPYQFLLQYAVTLQLSPRVVQVGWSLVSDSYLCLGCLQHPPHHIGCAALYLAIQMLKEQQTQAQNSESGLDGDTGSCGSSLPPSCIISDVRGPAVSAVNGLSSDIGGLSKLTEFQQWWDVFEISEVDMQTVCNDLLSMLQACHNVL